MSALTAVWSALRSGQRRMRAGQSAPPLKSAGPRGRVFHAASPHRLLSDWVGTSASANKATRYQAKALRHRARELRENSPLVARYASLVRDNVIGPDGVTLQAVVPSTRGVNQAASDQIETHFYRWAARCTPDGRSLVEACAITAEAWKIEGEGLLELIPSELAPYGLWVKPLDPDLLDETKDMARLPGGGSIVQGVEYDATGRIVRYHLFEQHPGDGTRQPRTLPAERLLVLAHRPRPEQTRGVTALAPVMLLINHLDRLQEALVVLNRTTASKMGALIPGEESQRLEGDDGIPPEIEQAPGEWWTLPHGYDVKMLDPGQPTAEYAPFSADLKRDIAAGLHVAAPSLTGNLSEVNYSSIRAGLLSERDAWMRDQVTFVQTVLTPLYALWLRTAVLSSALALPMGASAAAIADASVWHPRRWPWVDPMKDAQGIAALYDLGLTTKTREANKQGLSFRRLVDERKADDDYAAAQGVVFGPPAPVAAPTPDEDDATTSATPTPDRHPRAAV